MEKRIILAVFIIRKLIENDKVTDKTKSKTIDVFKLPRNKKQITPMNFWDIDEIYDYQNESEIKISITDLSNVCIHSRILYLTIDETGNWDFLLVTSDFKQEQYLLKIPVSGLIDIFETVITDYPTIISIAWNEEKGKYEKTTE